MRIGKYDLTKEMEHDRTSNISHIEERYIGEPTYSFVVGDKVAYGGMKTAEVVEVLSDGKMYGMICTHNDTRNSETVTCYRVAPWYAVRPLKQGTTNFTKNEDVRLYFNNATIDSLIHKHLYFGVNFEPDYQRGYVWTDKDKEYLLDSVFANIDIGKFVFVALDQVDDYAYEILDGKQRLSTLIDFYQNRIPYKGIYFNDLSFKDRRTFLEHSVMYCDIANVDENTKLRHFVMLNRAGKVMDEEHLREVENKITKIV